MKNALFLFGGYYPAPSANGLCCEKIMHCLCDNDYNVSCIVNRNINTQKKEENGNIKIYRISNTAKEKCRELFFAEKSYIKKKIYAFFIRIINAYAQILYTPLFPMNSPIKVIKYIIQSKKIIKKQGVHLLVSVNMPADAAIAGAYIKKIYPNIKSVAYFLDPLAGGGNDNKILNEKIAYKKALKTEKKIVECADLVIAQIEHKQHFEKEYTAEAQKKIHYLGAPLLLDKTNKNEGGKNGDKKTVIYAGALFKSYRDPRYIIDVFNYVNSAKLIMYVSNNTGWLIEHIKKTDNHNIEIRERIPRTELESEMKKADAFVNIGNNFELYAPSKIIEYISYGKPIISTYRIDNDTCAYYMKKYPQGLYLDERDADIKLAAKKIDMMWNKFNENISFAQLMELYYENTPQAFVEACNMLF